MINPINLSPFKRFCVTIGNLPTTYMESLSYYEMLEWLCNYLEKTVIPAINNNSEALEEVQNAFVELKNYVDNYFDNLDLQEEINNKLDEMAESGQLTDIIAQYLNLAGVLAYDTLNDLKNAENIVSGSITRILGKNSYNDGLGCYYKIREILNTDVIDNDNIIAITYDNTLVGEKIKESNYKYYHVKTTDNFNTIQEYFNQNVAKEIIFEKGNYTFNDTFRVNKNTKINFNNSTLTFNVPLWSEDWENSHGFFNFKTDDEFLGYNGNSNIEFYNGTIIGGNISFCHASNITIKNIHFINCKNNHIIEICALNNVLVDNCIFEGYWSSTNIESECIQFDEATYSNFPFMNEENPTYDLTYPKNITIQNCEFKNSQTEGYVMCNCIGNDSYIDNSYVENVKIKNNYFNNSINISIQLYNIKDLIIRDNNFYCNNQTAITNLGSHIRFRNQFENITIENNIFNGNLRAIETATPINTRDNLLIINNIIKNNVNYVSDITTIRIVDTKYSKIENNTFSNFINTCISIQKVTDNSSNEHYIRNNSFESTQSITASLIELYDGYCHVHNNEFVISNDTQSVIKLHSSSNEVYISDNIYNNYLTTNGKMVNFNDYDNNRKNIENTQLAWWGETGSVSNATLLNNLKFSDYKEIYLVLGYASTGNYCVTLKGYNPPTSAFLDNRVYKFDINGATSTLTINSDTTFSFSSNVILRNLILINN